MRTVQLFLLCFVALASTLAKDLQEEKCNNGVCPMDLDIWQEALKKMETMVKTTNNNVIATAYMNLTTNFEYATGQQIFSVETQETTFEIGEEGQLILKEAVVSYSRGIGVNDYETAAVLFVEEEITEVMNGSTISVEVGGGEFWEKQAEWVVVGNVSITGGQSSVKLSETVESVSSESIMIITQGGYSTKETKYVDALEVVTGDRVIINATEVVLTDVVNALSTATVRVYTETPLAGEDGPIIETAHGIVIVGEAEDTFVGVGEGYLVFVEENFKAAAQRKLFRPRNLFQKLSRFH